MCGDSTQRGESRQGVPPALIRWLTSVHSCTHKKMGPSNWPPVSSRETANKPPDSIDPAPSTPAGVQNNPKSWARGMKGQGCWDNMQGRELPIDLLHITTSDMHVGSCLLIMAKTYTIGGCCVTRSQEQSVDCCVRRLVRQGPTIFPQLSPFSGSASSCLDGEGGGGQLKMEGGKKEWQKRENSLNTMSTQKTRTFPFFLTTANL